mmetsp:Transcript_11681/g.16687  ORF Transcript_11681/g.16687 Transcript_11681/m.16687 type:complete len:485 (+) Transcript_11681:110-1564(+)|eukprot:CAMPEP_0202475782 /NCGR_PEP_ID=MMETSP1360-20130828/93081_1 /ASSEMBLY_ACC=CAM_ASM_000848 /TAXON_ID=515479 /ORGANISM="Licmophora paradoxa, Strain CCMP2313" /LENGTH=484 /DNA_ID=CAMNT_0049102963 /DNA_START=7 /DNA_END=1461 /DNA_ORIENTATION=-
MAGPGLTSTTAPGKTFLSRTELANHYKSDWHKFNLKRREAGLPLLLEKDFQARLDAALALRREREGREERSGTDHLKKNKNQENHKKKNKKNKHRDKGQVLGTGKAVAVSQVSAYQAMKDAKENEEKEEQRQEGEQDAHMQTSQEKTESEIMEEEEEPPVIDPRQCLFDSHMSPTIPANIERMQRKYGFFMPDQEYLIDMEGMLGYCHEKVKLGHVCLYCQKIFKTWQGCQKHMISTRHTKLRYERGVDLDEFDPFYDFSEADADFLGRPVSNQQQDMEDEDVQETEQDDGEWEDITDDEADQGEEGDTDVDMDEDDGLYAGYEDEIKEFGFDVSPLGELVFPDGRIIGHRGLARYYKQRFAPTNETTAVVAARQAAGERLYRGRVYDIGGPGEQQHESALALMRAGVDPIAAKGRAGKGVLVASGGGGYTAVSLYRYRAVVKKARRDEAQGQRLQHRSNMNTNRMDKKANRLMNDVSVAHAAR